MLTIKYGPNEFKGELTGFTAGSSEIEIEFSASVKVSFSAKSDKQYQTFNALRVAMNNIGLNKLRNSSIDFGTGRIDLGDEATTPIKKDHIKSSTSGGMVG